MPGPRTTSIHTDHQAGKRSFGRTWNHFFLILYASRLYYSSNHTNRNRISHNHRTPREAEQQESIYNFKKVAPGPATPTHTLVQKERKFIYWIIIISNTKMSESYYSTNFKGTIQWMKFRDSSTCSRIHSFIQHMITYIPLTVK